MKTTFMEMTEMIQATLIHVEDDDDWRDEVRTYIEEIAGLRFRNYISVSAISDINKKIYTLS